MMLRVLLVSSLLLGACGGGSKAVLGPDGKPYPAGPRFLDRIPADTPYVIASLEALPARYIERELFRDAAKYERVLDLLDQARKTDPAALAELDPEVRVLFEMLAEVRGKLSAPGMTSLGIDVRGRFALYGIGLIPVARLEIGDGDKLRAAVVRIFQRAQVPLVTRKLGKLEYWSWVLSDTESGAEIDAAILDDELVVTVVTSATRDRVLPLAFGDAEVGQSLADTGDIQKLAATHGFTAHSIGYVDLVGIARILVGDSSKLNNDVTAALGWTVKEPACATEIPALVDPMPRVAFGTYSFDERATSVGFILEMRKDIARAFQGMAAPVPGLDEASTDGAATAFGVGLDVGALIPFLDEKALDVFHTPHRCPHLEWMYTSSRELHEMLGQLAQSPFRTLRGFNVIVNDVQMAGGVPTSIAGLAFLATDDPAAILAQLEAYGGIELPDLAPGGAPQKVPVPGLGAGMFGEVFAARSKTALGLSVGLPGGGPLSKLLSAPPAADQPLAFWRINPRFLAQISGETEDDEYASMAIQFPELAEAVRAVDRDNLANTDDLTMALRTNEHGLVARINVLYSAR